MTPHQNTASVLDLWIILIASVGLYQTRKGFDATRHLGDATYRPAMIMFFGVLLFSALLDLARIWK